MIKMSKNTKEKCCSDASLIAARNPWGPFEMMHLRQCVSETLLISSGSSGKLKLSRDLHLSVYGLSLFLERNPLLLYNLLRKKRYCSKSWMARKQNISLLFYPEGLESFWGRLDHGLIYRHHSGIETLIRTNHSRDPLFIRISCSLYLASWRSWEN